MKKEFGLDVGTLNSTFRAFCQSEGELYERPYTNIVSKLGRQISENRLETWKKLFDNVGLLFVRDGRLHVTQFGHVLNQAWGDAKIAVDKSRAAVAQAAVRTLNRYQLLNPTTRNRDYPSGCDILPFRAIWHVMAQLDGRLHHEEFNRVILRVMTNADLPGAIAKIRSARQTAGYDPENYSQATGLLGLRVAADAEQATRRMTPWFSLAGFGGLLIDREPADGYRALRPEFRAMVDAELSTTTTYHDFADDEPAWFDYLAEAVQGPTKSSSDSGADDPTMQRVLIAAKRYGSSRLILLSGVAGTGKTRMARLAAQQLTQDDPSCYFETQFHESYSYEEFVEGLFPTSSGGFVPRIGIFRKANDRAKTLELEDTTKFVVLVIEEFSRANLSNVLGEIFTYIEHRKRNYTYPLSGDTDYISPKLILICTANPLDRSVAAMDDALIRRIREIEFAYDANALLSILEKSAMDASLAQEIISSLNPIAAQLPFGHGVFVDSKTENDLYELWSDQLKRYFIKPTGQRHPMTDEFMKAYRWTERPISIAPKIPDDTPQEARQVSSTPSTAPGA